MEACDRNHRPEGPQLPRAGFVYERAPFRSAHASTLAESGGSLVCAWFGGSREGASDVAIWLARLEGGIWSEPACVATGEGTGGARYPCWNPVLFQGGDGALLLFYKVGPGPAGWWGMVRESRDGGSTWGEAKRLPDGILGPIKNKPLLLPDGTLVSPSSTEEADGRRRWRVHFELSADGGKSWSRTGPAAPAEIDAIQPAILVHRDGSLQALGRTRSGRIFSTLSGDGGRTWSELELTGLPNPNSGIDAVTLRDGRHLLVYNHSERERSPLNLALSEDGRRWRAALALERDPGEYSYPAVIQAKDGLVHITYTWRRQRIRHLVVDPARLRGVPMRDGEWPPALR